MVSKSWQSGKDMSGLSSVKDSLLREGTAGRERCLFKGLWHLPSLPWGMGCNGSVPKSRWWIVLGPPRMELSGQQASCPSILPNTYIMRSQQITYPRCGCEVSCPALFGLGERSVTSKNSNLFLSEKLPTAGPICMTCLQWDALLAGVCLAHGNAVCFQDSSEGCTGDLQ